MLGISVFTTQPNPKSMIRKQLMAKQIYGQINKLLWLNVGGFIHITWEENDYMKWDNLPWPSHHGQSVVVISPKGQFQVG